MTNFSKNKFLSLYSNKAFMTNGIILKIKMIKIAKFIRYLKLIQKDIYYISIKNIRRSLMLYLMYFWNYRIVI